MFHMILRLFCAGILCICLCKALPLNCPAFTTCALRYLHFEISSFRYASLSMRDIATKIVDFTCENKHIVKLCYSELKQCADKAVQNKTLADMEKGTEIFCDHKADFVSAVICVSIATKNIEGGLKLSKKCLNKMKDLRQMWGSSGYCSLLPDVINCSQLTKESFKCVSPFVILLYEDGLNAPCISTFQALSAAMNQDYKQKYVFVDV